VPAAGGAARAQEPAGGDAPPVPADEGAMPPDDSPGAGVALGLYRVAFPDDLAAVAEYEAAAGRRLAVVHWYALWGGWKAAFDANADGLEAAGARGAVPMITWEPWAGEPGDPAWTLRQAVLSGRHDAYVDAWARGLAAFGRPVLVRFAHEMHDQPGYPWAEGVNGNTAADYLAAWRYLRRRFAALGARNVRWVWNPNTMGAGSTEDHERAYARLYPGDDEVDWVGLDVFNTGPELDWGAPRWRPFDEVLAGPYAAAGRVSRRPLVLPEVGCAEAGGSKAEWIRHALAPETLGRFPRVRALVWFDAAKEQPWHLRSSAAAYEAWLAALREGNVASALDEPGPTR
jgi:beta-mannanase